jgi:predicted metal-binding membrane protein
MEASVRRLSEPLVAWRLALVGTLCVLAALCWWWTVDRMSGMDMGPGSDPGTFGFFLTTWVVMMAAMMFPSIAPMVLMYASLDRSRRAWTPLFVAGYLIVWGAAGLIGFGVLKVGASVAGDFFAWDNAGRWTAVGVLVAAAVYEFTPAKYACLRRCRSPLGFLVSSWHEGSVGAVRMGVLHGAWCIGCCWALMAALFALGAMSIAWMAVVAALIAVEKLLPWRLAATAGVAVILGVLAVGVAASPANVPGLTVPSDSSGMSSMSKSMDSMSKPAMSKPAPKPMDSMDSAGGMSP